MLGISQMYLMVDLNSISMIYMKCYKLTCQWGLKQSAVLLHKNSHDGCGQYLFQIVPLNFLIPKKKKEINEWKCNRALLPDKCQTSEVIMIRQL